MNAAAVLSLIADLYAEVQAGEAERQRLTQENAALRMALDGSAPASVVPPA